MRITFKRTSSGTYAMPEARKNHRSRAAKGPFARKLKWAIRTAFVAFAAYCGLVALNKSDEYGNVGVVTELANGIAMSCGEDYDASQVVIFHPSLPCGTRVQVSNLANGRVVDAVVANNDVMFKVASGRIADISSATAVALGINPDASKPAQLSLRALTGKLQGLKAVLPVMAAYQPAVAPQGTIKAETLKALAYNIMGECNICGSYGMVAVAQVTQNRLDVHFNNKRTLHDIVYDPGDFSWTSDPKPNLPAKGSKDWNRGFAIATAYLNGNLSGDYLSVQYLITKDALYYYAFDVIKTPGWGHRNGKLEVVPMSNTLEVMLRHRFFRNKGTGADDVARIILARS